MKSTKSATRHPRSLRRVRSGGPGLALGLSAAMALPLAALAQTAPATPPAASTTGDTVLPGVKVQATAIDPNPNAETGVPYKAKTSADPRHTRPLAETPQTIHVITKAAIDDSGATDLRQILDAQPGITLGTGENGNAFGDRYIIRGQEARSDVFVDGLRDPGMTTRESFAIEQLEISKGPNSSFAGRGTAGGAINAVTKQATLDYDFTRASLGLGSDDHTRVTLDANKIFSDEFALRANLLYGDEDVPDRSPASRERKGVALSGLYEFSPGLQLVIDYYGLRADDQPDLGSYLVGELPNRVPAHPPAYVQDQDFLTSDVDTVTARLRWQLTPALSLDSRTRFGTSDNGYVVTGARGTTAYDVDGNAYDSATLSTHQGWQEVEYFAHQTNLRWDSQIGGRRNEATFGIEFTDHKVKNGVYDNETTGAYNCITVGRGQSTPGTELNSYCILDADGQVVSGLSSLLGREITRGHWDSDWHIKTISLTVMDTLDLTDRWSLFGGLRADHFKYTLGTYGTDRTTGEIVQASYDYSDTLTNGHLGLTYKVHPEGMVYASVASAADINGGESDVGTSSGYGGAIILDGRIAGADPEISRNIEIGTKWDLFDHKLLATAAVFRITKSDVMEGDGYESVGTFNSGKNRVQGVELGLVGNLTDRLTVQAGVAFLKSKVLESATDTNVGKPLSNFADRSADLMMKYRLTDWVSLGGAVRYESERCAGQPDTAAGIDDQGRCTQPIPAYTVLDLFGSVRFSQQTEVRLNLLNATDKDYYQAAYRSGAFLYKGDARALRVTLNHEF